MTNEAFLRASQRGKHSDPANTERIRIPLLTQSLKTVSPRGKKYECRSTARVEPHKRGASSATDEPCFIRAGAETNSSEERRPFDRLPASCLSLPQDVTFSTLITASGPLRSDPLTAQGRNARAKAAVLPEGSGPKNFFIRTPPLLSVPTDGWNGAKAHTYGDKPRRP